MTFEALLSPWFVLSSVTMVISSAESASQLVLDSGVYSASSWVTKPKVKEPLL